MIYQDKSRQPVTAETGRSDDHSPEGEFLAVVLSTVSSELGRESVVDPEDNFFDLGGDSLVALQVLRALQTSTGRRLRMRDLFGAADLRALSAALSRAPVNHPPSPPS